MATEDKTILIKVELQEAQAKVNIKKLEASIKSLDGRTKEYTLAVKKLASEELKLQQIQSKKVELNKQIALSNTQVGSSIKGVSTASGAASAATLELGRAISDAPYGIRGVANNISQFASQIAFMSRTMDEATGRAIGLGGAMKSLWKSILGPLGVLLAIQAAIAALDHFAGRTKKTEETIDSLSDAVGAAGSNLKILQQTLQDGLLTQEEANKAIAKANEEYKGLNLVLDENNQLTDESVISLNSKILVLEKLAKAQALQKLVEEKFAQLLPLQIKQKKLDADATLKNARAVDALTKSYRENGTATAEASASRARARAESGQKAIDDIQKEIDDLLKLFGDEDLVDETFKGSAKSRKNSENRIKEYKQQLLDLTKFILKQQEEEFEFTERNEWKLLKSKQEFEEKELKATRDAYLAKNQVRFDNFMKEAKDEDARNRARAERREANEVAELEYQNAKNALENKQIAEDNEFKRALEEKHLQSMAKLKEKSSAGELNASKKLYGTEAGSVGSPVDKAGAEGFGTLEEAYKAAGVVSDEAFQTALSLKEEQLRLSGLSEEQVKAEIAEMSYQNELERVQREIDLEKMKIDAKKNINQEYVSWVSGLSSVFQGIAGENEALAKAALVLEKGAAIAGIVISTQAANAKIIAGTSTEVSALRAQAALAGPAGIGLYAKAVIAEAAGKKRILKNNIGSGISIAKILATTLSSGGSSSGGTGGGGGGSASQDRTFDFNLVGNTGVNQLAQGIAGQFSGPIQAYVVSSQVTSQQQLDATIQSNATIG
jgi:hypothetical protein